MTVGYSKSAANTDAFALIAEGWNALVQDGHTCDGDSICPVGHCDEVLYWTAKEGDVVGVVTWATDSTSSTARLTLAYVEPSSRKRGVFKALMVAMVEMARKQGTQRLLLDVALENKEAQAALRHLNLQPHALTYMF